jgi:hypothetical protein
MPELTAETILARAAGAVFAGAARALAEFEFKAALAEEARPDGGGWQTQGRHSGTAFRLANDGDSVEGTSATGLDQSSMRPNF